MPEPTIQVSAAGRASNVGGHELQTLEQKLQLVGNPITMLRDSPAGRFKSPYPDQYTTWQEEQRSWSTSAVLFDQSHHMTDVYFEGPDVVRLLSDTGTNSFAGFGRDRAKHFVACADDGNMIGTAVLFGLESERASVVGPAAVANWLQFNAERRGYDVTVTRDERTRDQRGGTRLTFRFQLVGPRTMEILKAATGAPISPVPFFRMTSFQIAGVPVRALSHSMAGGAESSGMELFGDASDGPRVWEALLSVGAEFDLVRGGMLAYYTGSLEAGYAAQPTPAIYTDPGLLEYRQWLPADGYEGSLSVGGSFASDDVRDYYTTPWDFGYSHLVKFDHDFIGRAALEASRDAPHRRKVWLRWNDDDVLSIYASSLFGVDARAKYLETPLARYARVMVDTVKVAGRPVGISTLSGYTVNLRAWASVAFIDEEVAVDGKEVEITWGEECGGTAKLTVEPHVQTTVRAIVHTQRPDASKYRHSQHQ